MRLFLPFAFVGLTVALNANLGSFDAIGASGIALLGFILTADCAKPELLGSGPLSGFLFRFGHPHVGVSLLGTENFLLYPLRGQKQHAMIIAGTETSRKREQERSSK